MVNEDKKDCNFVNMPNVITFLRIPFSVAMLVASPFSALFWISYLGGGLRIFWLDLLREN